MLWHTPTGQNSYEGIATHAGNTSRWLGRGRLGWTHRACGDAADDQPGRCDLGTAPAAMMASKMLPPIDNPRVSLTALARDLHTGGTFFGRSGELWWDNILGGVLAAIGLTGIWIWLKNERRKVQVRAASQAARRAA